MFVLYRKCCVAPLRLCGSYKSCILFYRYLSIRSPLAYLKERTKRRAFIIIAAVWILSFTWIIPIYGYHHVFRGGDKLITGNYECETEFHLDTTFKFITSLFNFWIPLSLIIFTYIKIFGLIRRVN